MPQFTPPPKGARMTSDGGFERELGGNDPDDEKFEGWQHFGDYFDLKKSKLRDQTQDKVEPAGLRSNVLKGVVAHINGHTVPSRKELWELIAQHGGLFEQYPHASVTHIVVMELPDSKVQEWLRQPAKNRKPHVLPSWITTSVRRQKLEPWQAYLLPRLRDSSQRSVLDMRGSSQVRFARRPALAPDANGAAAAPAAAPDDMAQTALSCVRTVEPSPLRCRNADDQLPRPKSFASPRASVSTKSDAVGREDGSTGEVQSTKTDPDFVRKYFKRSRLHHIGTSRGKYQKYVAETCSNPMSQRSAARNDRAIMHIDMDCFFASVTMRTRPDLRDKPFVVCFASGAINRPVGEISSANYPARKFGIRAGMMSRDALERCPHLIGVPYEFDNYEGVSDKIYEIFARCIGHESGRIEAVSCDEAYLDVSGLDPNTTMDDTSQSQSSAADGCDSMPTPSWDVDRVQWAEAWATRIRTEVAAATGCPVSAGVGPNKLIARLATAAAKPDGQLVLLNPTDIAQHLVSLPVRQLPGLGYKGRRKLQEELGIEADMTVAAVRERATEESLKRVLGSSYGASLYMMLHGQDNRELETQHVRKSYSAEVNWGVRFDTEDHAKVRRFVHDIADYVSEELQHLGFVASALSIKIKRKKKHATTPYKMLGHGPCDNFTKSTSFGIATSDAKVIGDEACRLYDELNIPPNELRGAGIMMSKLSSVQMKQQVTGRVTRYFQPVSHVPSVSTHASGDTCSIVDSTERLEKENFGMCMATEEVDILASQGDNIDQDGDGRPSFSQTLDPETLSQQSSELRRDLGCYDEETATWKDHATATLQNEEPSGPTAAAERRSCRSGTTRVPVAASDSNQTLRDIAETQSSGHKSKAGDLTVTTKRSSIDRDDFIPRLSQVDPEIMAALGSEWASICVAELSDNQNQRESEGTVHPSSCRPQAVTSTAAAMTTAAMTGEGSRCSMGPPPATGHARRSSPGRAGSRRSAFFDCERPQKRRKPAQQTLVGMQQNAAKWNQLQHWAETDPEVGAILKGMSKEQQLAMFDDLRQAKTSVAQPELVHDSLSRRATSHERGQTTHRTAAPTVQDAMKLQVDTHTVAQSRTRDESNSSMMVPADQRHNCTTSTDWRAHPPLAGQAANVQATSGPTESIHDRAVAAGTSIKLAGVNVHADTASASTAACVLTESNVVCTSVDMHDGDRVLGNEVDYEDLHEASARLVAQHEAPCDSIIDVLALGFWQILEDSRLLAAEAWLQFFRRIVAGSEWRPGASREWVQGYNELLERCQQLVHHRYGSFLSIAQIAEAHGTDTAGASDL